MAIHAEPQLYQENFRLPLCNHSQGWWRTMESGSDFVDPYFNITQQKQQLQGFHQQQQQQQNHLYQQQMNQDFSFMQYGHSFHVPAPRNNNDHFSSVAFSQSIAAQLNAQRQQLDYYLRVQDESLRFMLQIQRKQQLEMLMKKIESKASTLLSQKDAEIANAIKRQMELAGLLSKLEMEGQEWKKMAQENEAVIESLNNTLEELREKNGYCISNNAVEDAESCCDVNMIGGDRNEQETGESSSDRRLIMVDNDDDNNGGGQCQTIKMTVCKGCNIRESCMLFLPCRHLCSCKSCEAFLGWCPVCRTTKKASVEALL